MSLHFDDIIEKKNKTIHSNESPTTSKRKATKIKIEIHKSSPFLSISLSFVLQKSQYAQDVNINIFGSHVSTQEAIYYYYPQKSMHITYIIYGIYILYIVHTCAYNEVERAHFTSSIYGKNISIDTIKIHWFSSQY